MNNINAHKVSQAKAEDFIGWVSEFGAFTISFFDGSKILVSGEVEIEPEHEIQLTTLCRRSKEKTKSELRRKKCLKI